MLDTQLHNICDSIYQDLNAGFYVGWDIMVETLPEMSKILQVYQAVAQTKDERNDWCLDESEVASH